MDQLGSIYFLFPSLLYVKRQLFDVLKEDLTDFINNRANFFDL